MAAGDFSASTYPDVLAMLDELRTEQRWTNQMAEFKYRGALLKELFSRQSVRGQELLERGDICKSVTVFYNEFGSDTVISDGATKDAGFGCDLQTGPQGQTRSVTYDVNSFTLGGFVVDDDKCDNASDFNMEVAMGFLRARKDVLRRLNERGYALLAANVQANQSSLYDTSVFPAPTVPDGNFLGIATGQDNEDTLIKMEELFEDNAIPETYRIASIGNSFWNKATRGAYYATTDDKNDIATIYQDYRMFFDRPLAQVAGNSRVFVYNPSNFMFWNTTYTSPVPVLTDPSKNKMVFYWQDPDVTWMKNGRPEPLKYEIRYDWTCTGTNSRGKETYQHRWEFHVVGCMAWAPPGFAPLSDGTETRPITGVLGFIQN